MRHCGEQEQGELLTFRGFLGIYCCDHFPSLVGIEGQSRVISKLAKAAAPLRLQVCSCHLFSTLFVAIFSIASQI